MSTDAKPAAPPHKHAIISKIFSHIPHPHIHHRKTQAPRVAGDPPEPSGFSKFNNWIGAKVTAAVGTMWCAYIFAALALVSLPDAIDGGTAALVSWIAQTFIQLVLLSIIMVGQKIGGVESEKRAIDTYNDAEAVLHEALQIQQHLAAQDEFLHRVIVELEEFKKSIASTPPAAPPAA